MKKPSYSLNNSSLFFGLNEMDFILLGVLFLLGFFIFKMIQLSFFAPILYLLFLFFSLVGLRIKFRRYFLRDFLKCLFQKKETPMRKILHRFEKNGCYFFLLDTFTLVTAFELSPIDPDRNDLEETLHSLSQLALSLPGDTLLRITLFSDFGVFDQFSTREINEIGFYQEKITLTLEKQVGVKSIFRHIFSSKQKLEEKVAEELLQCDLKLLKTLGLRLSPSEKLPFFQEKIIKISPFAIERSADLIGIIKYLQPTTRSLDLKSFYELRQSVSRPYIVVFKTKKILQSVSELLLRTRSSQMQAQKDKISLQKYYDSEDLLEKIALERESLFEYELYLVLPRFSEKELREEAHSAIQSLKPFGQFNLETFGAFSCFQSLIAGNAKHLSFKETSSVLPLYFPLVSTSGLCEQKESSLFVHREDHGIDTIDLFHPKYDAYSAIICGKTGCGKSVLTNLFTEALLNDPSVFIIKVDVGGSHSKQTQYLKGEEYNLSLDLPSGINPFSWLLEDQSESTISVLSQFLFVLMTEENEKTLSKEERAEIEKELFFYTEKMEVPSLDEFLKKSGCFPRKTLLNRWGNRGIYQNALKNTSQNVIPQSRLRYYNFSNIHQAQDMDFGQGGFALVMAQFNFEMMRQKERKLIFIADETPFFIQRCFSFFKFSTANVRKFGGSFISISQKTTDLIVNNDHGIIENSPHRFLFSLDGKKEEFQERFALSDQKMTSLIHLSRVPGQYSEVLYQDKYGEKILKLILSQNEYWRYSSSYDDNKKLAHLLKAVPGLTHEEAIKVFSKEYS